MSHNPEHDPYGRPKPALDPSLYPPTQNWDSPPAQSVHPPPDRPHYPPYPEQSYYPPTPPPIPAQQSHPPYAPPPHPQPPYAAQPFTPQPFTPQPFTPQPFTPQPFTPQPFTPQPFTPQPFTPQHYPQPPYPQPPYPQPQPAGPLKRTEFGWASIIVGGFGLFLSWIPILGYFILVAQAVLVVVGFVGPHERTRIPAAVGAGLLVLGVLLNLAATYFFSEFLDGFTG